MLNTVSGINIYRDNLDLQHALVDCEVNRLYDELHAAILVPLRVFPTAGLVVIVVHHG